MGWMIFLGILAFLLFLLSMPVCLRFSYARDELSLCVRYLFFRMPLSADTFAAQIEKQTTDKKGKKGKKAEVPADTKKEKAARSAAEVFGSVIDLMRSARGPWNILRRHIVFSRVRLYFVICAEDAHRTALRYTGFSNAVFASLALLGSVFSVRQPTVFLYPDFSGVKSRYDLSFRLHIRPIFAVAAALCLLYRMLTGRTRRKAISVKGGKKYEPTASRQ